MRSATEELVRKEFGAVTATLIRNVSFDVAEFEVLAVQSSAVKESVAAEMTSFWGGD